MINEHAVKTASDIPGWMSQKELEWLSQSANQSDPINWLEIGTMLGRSWLCVALSLPSGSTIVTVDKGMWSYTHNKSTWRSGHWVWGGHDYTLQQTQQLFSLFRKDIKTVFVKAEATEALDLFPKDFFNHIFIDACHTYEGTKNQINKALLYHPTAVLSGHDYNPQSWPGVVQAVDELLPSRLVVSNTTIWTTR